jgi:GntR family transcriptional regulator/MocR family aminotransferase
LSPRRELPISLDSSAKTPIYVQVARALTAEIRRGRLAPGAALPGTRSLAASLGIHRNTVLAAYAELVAEGWLRARPGGGTYVSEAIPEPEARRFSLRAPLRRGLPSEPAFELRTDNDPGAPFEMPAARYALLGGVPDLRLVPVEQLARAYSRALRRGPKRLLGYASAAGEPRLRAALATLVTQKRGVAAEPKNVIVTRGSQMALELAARVLCAPGDAVAVEALGYKPAWRALEAAGARLVPIPVDRAGLVVPALARLLRRERIRAIYVSPHHQYPTTAVMAPGRRIELLELAARERFAILEDDYDHEFHYEGRPVLPLASADANGSVLYLGTLSKVLAPGLRLGFVVAPEKLVERLARERFTLDRQGDHVLEAAVAELIEEGELDRHVRKMRALYRKRRDALVDALACELGGRFVPHVPAGGMALWGRATGAIDVDAWRDRALERGVLMLTASDFAFDGRSRPFVRLGFAGLDESELREAARRLSDAWPEPRRTRRSPAKARSRPAPERHGSLGRIAP